MHKEHAYYYEAAPVPTDGAEATILLFLLIVGFLAAIYWLATWKPGQGIKREEKKLREEIDGIFNDLRSNALMLKREEVVPSLEKAREKVTDVLKKRELL